MASPEAIGIPAAVLALGMLFRPGWMRWAPLVAGWISGVAVALVIGQVAINSGNGNGGSAVWTAAMIAGGVALPILSNRLARHPEFAPAAVQEESLIFIGVLAAIVAATPGIATGWARALALSVAGPTPQPVPAWAFAMGAASAGLGGIYCLWRRAN